jgi:hypothetical protein
MTSHPLRIARLALSATFSASLLLASAPSLATPVMDMRAEDLVPMAIQFRQELTLTPNQLTLWQQVETRSKALLRERVGRREKLQAALVNMAAQPKVELRDLNTALEAEQVLTAKEDQQLQALWLEVNDALDDKQRQQVAAMVSEQLMRVGAPEGRAAPKGEERGQRKGGGGKRGGMGGPGA